jgi:DNA-binding NtrC family response regulator
LPLHVMAALTAGETSCAPSSVILYVEDNDYVRESVAELLQAPGRQFVCCSDAGEALEVLENRRIDLLITDLNLPGVPGMDLVRSAMDRDPPCPVVVCSGHDLSATAFADARIEYVRKPFELEELEAVVDRLLETRGH